MSKRKLSLEVVKRLQCQKSVKVEGKKRALKTVQKREKTIYNFRKFRVYPIRMARLEGCMRLRQLRHLIHLDILTSYGRQSVQRKK
mgnify:CR=1 FL=1